jgi:hypothetical protein
MEQLADRDERFVRAWCRWYPSFVMAVLGRAQRILPRKAYIKVAILACDTAEPMGALAGAVYCIVRDVGDLIRWLVFGPPKADL